MLGNGGMFFVLPFITITFILPFHNIFQTIIPSSGSIFCSKT